MLLALHAQLDRVLQVAHVARYLVFPLISIQFVRLDVGLVVLVVPLALVDRVVPVDQDVVDPVDQDVVDHVDLAVDLALYPTVDRVV